MSILTRFKGEAVDLVANQLEVGDKAPVVTIVGADLNDIEIGGAKERVQLIISVPSLDTKTCAAETKRFNQEVGALDICQTYVVSMDLPFASAKFCTTEGIENLDVGSDYVEKEFSNKYGVLMTNGKLRGLSARAIFVVNRSGVITYKQIVPELTDEPNYEEVLEAIKEAR
ncbi:MAG: thiol peroxidase [Campylobacterales bacterium]|nr:thiol peroxidase [Campylobacterales bacterium]